MIPLQCGTSTHTLLALYDPAVAGGNSSAVVICNPWGREHIRAYGTIRFLAKRLQLAGHHVLRFDYYGCGDSGGDFTDATIGGWCQDTIVAIEQLKALTGGSKVTLIGARFGATIASQTATQRSDIDRLVLWDPIIDTTTYLADLVKQSRGAGVKIPLGWPGADQDEPVDVDGSLVTPAMAKGMANARFDVSNWGSVSSVFLIASCQPLAEYEPLVRHCEDRGIDLKEVEQPWRHAWSAEGDFETRAVPLDAVDAIVKSLS